jgi:hypothetical protein
MLPSKDSTATITRKALQIPNVSRRGKLLGNEKKKDRNPKTAPGLDDNEQIDPNADVLLIMEDKLARLQYFKPALFDFKDIQIDSTIALYGKRRTGKTFMTKYLWSQQQIMSQIPVFWVVSPTAKLNKSWEDIIPSEYIHEEFDSYFIQRIINRQKFYLTNPIVAHRNPWCGLMLDDAVADSGVRYSDTLLRLFIAGRHYKIHLVTTTQYPTLITPKMRANLDYAFIFTQISRREREHIRDQYMAYLHPDYADAIIDYYTRDNHCIVINLSVNSTDPEKCVFYTKAVEPPKNFKLGCKEYWDVHNLKKAREIEKQREILLDKEKMHKLDRRSFTLVDNFEDN